jgi:hypothetical protein
MLIKFTDFPYSPSYFNNYICKNNDIFDFNGFKFFLRKTESITKRKWGWGSTFVNKAYYLHPAKTIYACSTIKVSNSEVFRLDHICWRTSPAFTGKYNEKITFKKAKHCHDINRTFRISTSNDEIFFLNYSKEKCIQELESFKLLS